MHKRLCPSLGRLRERERVHAPVYPLPDSHAAVPQRAAARVRDGEGRVRHPQMLLVSREPSASTGKWQSFLQKMPR